MLVVHDGRTIERVAVSKEASFLINATGKAFRILSSGLYRDKILAIIRELCCNARDAHAEGGRPDQPYHVHLPNALEPYFSVTDAGLGLSPHDIETIYQTYFASTKTKSNLYVGHMGLGGKSPFSYVDSFTLRSRHGGNEYQYVAYISEDGTPRITQMSQQAYVGPTGFEVRLAAKTADFHQFAIKAKWALGYFAPVPTVGGVADFTVHASPVLIQGEDWALTERLLSPQDSYINGCRIIMGGVAYPIDLVAIAELSDKAKRLYNLSLDIRVPIGAVDVTASREDLSYDPNTLLALERRAMEVIEDAPSDIQKALDACQSEYEARYLFGRILVETDVLKIARGLGVTKAHFLYRGEVLDDAYLHYGFAKDGSGRGWIEAYLNQTRKYERTQFPASRLSCHVHANPKALLVLDDISPKSGLTMRINLHRKKDARCQLYVLGGTPEVQQAMLAAFDGVPFIKASSLPRPKRVDRSEPVRGWMLTFEGWNSYGPRSYDSHWKRQDIDISDGGIYVLKRGNVVVQDTCSHDSLRTLRLTSQLHLFDTKVPVYGIDVPTMKKCILAGGWTNLHDAIRANVDRVLHGSDVGSLLPNFRRHLAKERLGGDDGYRLINMLQDATAKFPADHILKDFVTQYGVGTTMLGMELAQLCSLLRVTFPEGCRSLIVAMDQIAEQYPLIDTFNPKNLPKSQHVRDYVVMMDARRQSQNL